MSTEPQDPQSHEPEQDDKGPVGDHASGRPYGGDPDPPPTEELPGEWEEHRVLKPEDR